VGTHGSAIHTAVTVGNLCAMHFERREIHTAGGPRVVLVVNAEADTVFGAEKLAELRANSDLTVFDEITGQLGKGGMPHAVCLRGRGSDGSGQFRMAPSLEDDELDELGYRLLRAVMPALRRLVRAGVGVIAVVELRVREQAALRAGAARLLARVRQATNDPAEREIASQTQRVLEHHLFWSGVGLETALEELVPSRLAEQANSRVDEGKKSGTNLHPA
jgi:hypothetical protein